MLVNAFPEGKKAKPYVTEEITTSGTWTVPEGVHEVEVMLFGGGGAGYYRQSSSVNSGGGGGSGYMNRGKFYVTPGQQIPVTIGAGATDYSSDGGTTSFGDMLSANGGQSGSFYKGGDGFAGGGGYADSSENVPYRFAGHGVGGGDGGWHGHELSRLFRGVSTATAQGGDLYVSSSSTSSRAGGGGGGMNGGNGGKGGPNGGGGGGGYGIKKLTSGTSGGTGYGAGGGGTSPAGAPGICVIQYKKG